MDWRSWSMEFRFCAFLRVAVAASCSSHCFSCCPFRRQEAAEVTL